MMKVIMLKLSQNIFGTRHNEIYADEIEPEIMFDLSKQFDEPLTDFIYNSNLSGMEIYKRTLQSCIRGRRW